MVNAADKAQARVEAAASFLRPLPSLPPSLPCPSVGRDYDSAVLVLMNVLA